MVACSIPGCRSHVTENHKDMSRFKVKFFGSKERKGQIAQVKMIVEATDKGMVEEILHNRYSYEKINGLKITVLP